jgi:hypothetical protein
MTPTSEYPTISLTQGQVAIVDADDFEWLSQFAWYAHICRNTRQYYARCGIGPKRNMHQILMHRMILGLTNPRIGVDHINRDTLDNRRVNLRIATKSQNGANAKVRSDNTSGLKGVSFHKGAGKWAAQIHKDGRTLYLGLHATPESAHKAYCEAAAKVHGEFARAK